MASITDILPFEIITIIIDNLAIVTDQDNTNGDPLVDLRACSLTCHDFLPLCRKHIFKSISLESHDSGASTSGRRPRQPSSTTLFAQLVRNSPSITDYAQELHFRFESENFKVDYFPDAVSSALRPLTKLKAIHFFGLTPTGSFFNWERIPSFLRSILLVLVQLPTITYIEVAFIKNFALYDLVPCAGLKTLQFKDTSIIEAHKYPPSKWPMIINSIQLDRLNLLECHHPLTIRRIMIQKCADGKPIIDLKNLKNLSMELSNLEDIRSTSELLQYTSSRLETVKFTIFESLDPGALVSLASATSLKTLRYLEISFEIENDYGNPLSGICTLLQRIASTNHIEVLRIHPSFHLEDTCGTEDEWGILEQTLLTPGWSSLTQVDLNFTVYTFNELPEDTSPETTLEKLPQTQFKGLLSTKSFIFNFGITKECLRR